MGLAALLLATLAACGGPPAVPPPRPLVLYSGVRLTPTQERLNEIDEWIRPQLENIQEDPSFLIRTVPRDSTMYPWEGLEIVADTADIALGRGASEAQVPYMIYAHLHLMEERGELEQWLPESAEETGYELERAIMSRTSDAWLYGRSAWDAPPYEALDEIVYSTEYGYLDAFLFTARPDAFTDARRAWLAENPGGIEEYRRWFVETFNREPPGLRDEEEGSGNE
ncbi:MAG: hypothetical protein R3223_00230 [Longimicrobiales bacterium]|nr:hypothetical protein [Longimicrobiales bacterium]